MKIHKIIFVILAIAVTSCSAQNTDKLSKLDLQQVAPNIYAIVGDLTNRTPENLGNNATFGFIVSTAGVILIDSGATPEGAKRIHDVIKTVTKQPIKIVINTGGQDHRWLGNSYFKKQGVRIIASAKAVADQKNRTDSQLSGLENLMGKEAIKNIKPVYATNPFDESRVLTFGNIKLELHHVAAAHTPGDIFVWLPEQKVMFAGDIVYMERILGIGKQSSIKGWLKTYEAMQSYNPKHVIPGHGSVTTLQKANADTYSYLKLLRKEVANFIENNGDIANIRSIDQSKYKHLLNYDALASKNAYQVYTELEWE